MRRRRFLAGVGTGVASALGGCLRQQREREFELILGNSIPADVSVQLVFTVRGTEEYNETVTVSENQYEKTVGVDAPVAMTLIHPFDGPTATLHATVETESGSASDTLTWEVQDRCDLETIVITEDTVSDPSISVRRTCL